MVFLSTISLDFPLFRGGNQYFGRLEPMTTLRATQEVSGVAGDTWITTERGPRLAGDLSPRRFTSIPSETMLQLTTLRGRTLIGSESLLIQGGDNNFHTLSSLVRGDMLALFRPQPPVWGGGSEKMQRRSYLLGWLVTSGCCIGFYAHATAYVRAATGGAERAEQLSELVRSLTPDDVLIPKPKVMPLMDGAALLEMPALDNIARTLMVPATNQPKPEIEVLPSKCMRAFLAGVFDSVGTFSVSRTCSSRVTIPCESLEWAGVIQRMLHHFGVIADIHNSSRGYKLLVRRGNARVLVKSMLPKPSVLPVMSAYYKQHDPIEESFLDTVVSITPVESEGLVCFNSNPEPLITGANGFIVKL